MAQKQITVTVEDSAYDLMEGLTTMVVAVKAAKSLGVAAEIEAGVAAAITAFSTKINEMQSLEADLVADHAGFYRGVLNGVEDLIEAFEA